jgi:hypothetical protein
VSDGCVPMAGMIDRLFVFDEVRSEETESSVGVI